VRSGSAKKKLLGLLGGLALALILLIWVFYNTDKTEVWAAIQGVSLPLLLLVPICNMVHNCFRSWRWRVLLSPVRPQLPFWSLFYAIVLGYGANIVVPGRIGELVRPAVLSAKEKISLGATMGSMLPDRLLDLISAAILFAVGLSLVGFDGARADIRSSTVIGGLTLMVIVLAFPALVFLLVDRFKTSISIWVESKDGVVQWLGRSMLSIASGVEAIGNLRLIPKLVALSGLMWIFIVLGIWFGLKACSISLSLPQVMVLLPLLVVGFALPTPGGAGGYHASMTFGLVGLFGVDKSHAAATSIVLHLVITVAALLIAAACLSFDRMKLADLSSLLKNPELLDKK
jgi:uncharacterized protein (TIRG00374 family)